MSKKFRNIASAGLAVIMAAQALIPMAASAAETFEPYANRTIPDAYGKDTYKDRFLSLYDDVITKGQENGYLSKDNVASGAFGVPYHSVETLIVEAPDYGHETTSEAMSYIVWVAAMRDNLTQGTSDASQDMAKAWKTMEIMIPTVQTNYWNTTPSASYADEYDTPQEYPSPNDFSNTGKDPLHDYFKRVYSSDSGLYLLHWLADVDNWYGYGGSGNDFTFINTFQRGAQESCWETVPHPSIEEFKYGNTSNGFLGILSSDGNPAKQWRYTNAPDAEGRAIQAAYAANRWGVGDSNVTTLAGKMADQVRSNMFDKYYKKIGSQSKQDSAGGGAGYDSAHYLMSWYTSWGGAMDGGWSFKIGASHVHEFYQNPLQAYAVLEDSDLKTAMKAENAVKDWETSLTRQLELYQWLQSAEGPFAGGCTNSYNGRYEKYPSGTPTFYDMAYLEHPVYLDPGSNHWIGNQVWSTQRIAELYLYALEDGDTEVADMCKSVLDSWIQWAVDNIHFDDDVVSEYNSKLPENRQSSYVIPASVDWTGAPETWTGTNKDNTNLHAEITAYGAADIGCVASFANTLLQYAKAVGVEAEGETTTGGTALGQSAFNTAKELLDRLWNENRDDIGVAKADTNTNFTRLFEQEVWVPNSYQGKMANGDEIKTGVTFLDLRTKYKQDPKYAELEADYNDDQQTQDTEFIYHRFWHAGDLLMALGTMADLFPNATLDEHITTTTTTTTTTDSSAVELVWGDINCDGKVTTADLVMLSKYLVSSAEPTAQGLLNVDVTHDGNVTTADLVKLSKYLVNLITIDDLAKA